MRSDLIFGALTHVTNRYKLCQLASKATRKLHKPNTRLQDTTNEVLDRFKDTIPMDVSSETAEVVLLTPVRRAA
jgi:predicted transcriptional regulator